MVAVESSSPGNQEAVQVDVYEALSVARRLKRLGAQVRPTVCVPPEAAGPEQSVAATVKMSEGGNHVANECATLLEGASAYLEKTVRALKTADQRNAAVIEAIEL